MDKRAICLRLFIVILTLQREVQATTYKNSEPEPLEDIYEESIDEEDEDIEEQEADSEVQQSELQETPKKVQQSEINEMDKNDEEPNIQETYNKNEKSDLTETPKKHQESDIHEADKKTQKPEIQESLNESQHLDIQKGSIDNTKEEPTQLNPENEANANNSLVDLVDKRRKRRNAQLLSANPKKVRGSKGNRAISTIIHILLIASGFYITMVGFRVFRLLMIILGFYVSYYTILFFETELNLYNSNSVAHQLILFIASVLLGFGIAISCYMFEKANFIIFGIAVGTVISLFYAQFFVNFNDGGDRFRLFALQVLASGFFVAAAFFIIDQAIIWGSAFVGAIIIAINVGVIFGDFDSFEQRSVMPLDRLSDFKRYFIDAALLFFLGAAVQYNIRERIVRSYQEKVIKDYEESTFVDTSVINN